VFLAISEGRLSLSVKLPDSGVLALELPSCEPTGYGLGRPGDAVPIGRIAEWFEESLATIAPKRVAAGAPVREPSTAEKTSTAKR